MEEESKNPIFVHTNVCNVHGIACCSSSWTSVLEPLLYTHKGVTQAFEHRGKHNLFI